MPAVQKLTIYSEINYAIPFAVMIEPWNIREPSMAKYQDPLPEPVGKWPAPWWEVWNIQTLNTLIKKMYDDGISNLFPLPSASTSGGETRWTNFLAYSYGGSVLNSTGRCGLLDTDAVERALTDTLVYWRNLTHWNYTALLPYDHSNPASVASVDVNKYGVLSWRGVYSPGFLEWFNSGFKENPWDEPTFVFADSTGNVSQSSGGYGLDAPQIVQSTMQAFAFENGYGSYWTPVVPATGSAYMQARLIGINKDSSDKEEAYEALMVAFARNKKFLLNSPNIMNNNQGGLAGYISTQYIKGYSGTGRALYYMLADHAMFAGAPVAQSMSYGLIEDRNPLQLAWNEILYKSQPVREALRRACVVINNLTRPACTLADYEPFLVDVPGKNRANIEYRLPYKKIEDQCNDKLANAVRSPPPLREVVYAQFTSSKSKIASAMIGVAGACMVLIVILISLFILMREAPVIRAASRGFSLLILVGGLLTLSSVILRTSRDNELGWPQCFGTYWFFVIGYAFIMGSLGVKSYRVDRIFRNKKTSFKLSDSKLYAIEGVIVLGEVVIMLIYQFALEDSSWEQTIEAIPGLMVSQKHCPIPNGVAPILLYVWNAALILFAAIFAFRTRNVNSAFNENIFTVAAIGLISIISIVIVPVISIITQPDGIFLLISLGTIFGTILSILVFAIPKLLTAFGILNLKELKSIVTASVTGRKSGERAARPSGTMGRGVMSSGGTSQTRSSTLNQSSSQVQV